MNEYDIEQALRTSFFACKIDHENKIIYDRMIIARDLRKLVNRIIMRSYQRKLITKNGRILRRLSRGKS